MLHLLRRQFVLLVGAVCLLAPGFAEAEEKNAEAKDKEAKRKAAAAKAPTYVIHRVKTKIVVDGRADEEDWKNAASVGDWVFGFLPEPTGKEEQTVFKMLWDDQYIYFAAVCEDRALLSKHRDRDGMGPLDDSVEVYITPHVKTAQRHYAFYVNVHASLYDEKFDGEGKRILNEDPEKAKLPNRKSSWNSKGVKVAATSIGTLNNHKDIDRSWSLEIAVPYANFADSGAQLPPKPNDVWKLNPNRHAYLANGGCHYSQWAPTIPITGSFWGPDLFGNVVFSGEPVSAKE